MSVYSQPRHSRLQIILPWNNHTEYLSLRSTKKSLLLYLQSLRRMVLSTIESLRSLLTIWSSMSILMSFIMTTGITLYHYLWTTCGCISSWRLLWSWTSLALVLSRIFLTSLITILPNLVCPRLRTIIDDRSWISLSTTKTLTINN
jgi:hypothetical protein